MKKLMKVAIIDAHGGPEKEIMGSDGHSKTPTNAGRFIVNKIERHVSYGKYAFWSGIPWGTDIKLDPTPMVKLNGNWVNMTAVNQSFKAYIGKEADLKAAISSYYNNELGYKGAPIKWLFNDFGHISIKYFKDNNKNGFYDKGDQQLGDFIHTTPSDEAKTDFKKGFALVESHGCIHVKPNDIDTLINSRFIKKGVTIEVHPYTENFISANLNRPTKPKQEYEVHFYPGILKLVIYKILN
jgi:hypothetical protein